MSWVAPLKAVGVNQAKAARDRRYNERHREERLAAWRAQNTREKNRAWYEANLEKARLQAAIRQRRCRAKKRALAAASSSTNPSDCQAVELSA